MPPRAARIPIRDSVSVAVRKHLCTAAAAAGVVTATKGESARASTTATPALETVAPALSPSSSRVSRRRRNVVPQATPEWQRMALNTAAAARPDKRRGGGAGAKTGGSSATAVAVSRKSPAVTAKNTKSNGRHKHAEKERAKAEGHEDEAAATVASPLHAESDANSSSGGKHAKPRRGKAGKATAAPTAKRGKRVPVAELLCPRCRLRIDQWPYCGLSGEAHELRAPRSVAKEEDGAAAAAVAAP
ncbi:hypothetical protein GH5_04864 [Leishmania sp. Ghana 2012 LV757]|uniref:hypothetical protein n=1 Tax=Leishmania sp. Ghana 2012 LV757 TaxID=2803181 RepID=UPI001B75134B|nr:hypothetical protein GH5_04864 [Leishmania sp. Ghana 2012 LV757]